MSTSTIAVEIAPTFFRKSAIKKTVTIISCEERACYGLTMRDFALIVECEGRRFAVSAYLMTETNSASACGVRQMWQHPTMGWDKPTIRRRHERRDAGHTIAIQRACTMHVVSLTVSS